MYLYNNYIYVVGVMNMENIVPRVGLKPTSLAIWASVLPFHHVGSLMSPLYPHLPVYATPCLKGLCRLLHSSTWNYKSSNAYNYIHKLEAMTLHIYIHILRVHSTTIHHVACIGS